MDQRNLSSSNTFFKKLKRFLFLEISALFICVLIIWFFLSYHVTEGANLYYQENPLLKGEDDLGLAIVIAGYAVNSLKYSLPLCVFVHVLIIWIFFKRRK